MILRCAVWASVCAALTLPVAAWADPTPPPPPPIPNVNTATPLNPTDYAVPGSPFYGFAGPAGVTCIINKMNGDYACSGSLPGAPDGANLVSAGQAGPPAFSTTPQPLFAGIGPVKTLPPNTRLSFRDVSCAPVAGGGVACLNSYDQGGFVVSPSGSYVNVTNPLLDRPSGTPLVPGLPPVFPGMPKPPAPAPAAPPPG